MKIIKSPEESSLGINVFSEIIQNEAKEQEDGFLIMLFNTLGASLLENLLTGEGTIRAGEGVIKANIFNTTSSFN